MGMNELADEGAEWSGKQVANLLWNGVWTWKQKLSKWRGLEMLNSLAENRRPTDFLFAALLQLSFDLLRTFFSTLQHQARKKTNSQSKTE